MSVWAVVPQKGFDRGKSRLTPTLPDGARSEFARALFNHVVAVLDGVVDGVLVCTDSTEVANAAAQKGAEVLQDPPRSATLAAIVDAGLAEVASRGARAALVLMADLPRLSADDVRKVLALLAEHDVVIVRAKDGYHTNALALAPPRCLATAFGRAESFDAHLRAAQAAGLRVCVLENRGIAFDVDGPEDHAELTTPIRRE